MNRLHHRRAGAGRPDSGAAAPSLVVWTPGHEWSLAAGASYLVGRDPQGDIVIPDARVSWRHAALQAEGGRWVLTDSGSTNGTYAGGRRVDRIEISEECLVQLGDPVSGPVLSCSLSRAAAPGELSQAGAGEAVSLPAPSPGHDGTPAGDDRAQAGDDRAQAADDDGELEIPYAIRWLVPRGERFANFDILNDNDTQLDYFRRFGVIYAVGIPTKKWRLVVVSDPELLDQVAADEEQFGKSVEEINFFDQLSNSRGGGISVIGDGDHYERIRRVMLPWYAPSHQRTQLEMMKGQARKLVAAWSAMPSDEPLDARAWMERYTLEVSGRGACAYNFGLLEGSPDQHRPPHPFAAAVPASTKESILRVAEARPDFTAFAGRARRRRLKAYRRHNEELFRTADTLVRARMHTCPLGPQTDLLSRLVSTPDPQNGELLDAETIRDQILMHLSNGFNGPSITAAWLAYVLATHPDVEAKLIAEIDKITGGDPDYDLRYDDLMALTYTTQVIKETMRIYPPMPVTIRRSLKDGTLGRYRVRRGDIILVGTLAAQRDPRYWGPDPDRFDPEQFAMEKVVDRPRHAFIPFSIGKRQCMAQEVTFMMLRVLLFEVYRRYRLRLAPGATVTKNTVVTTKPAAVPVIRRPRVRRPEQDVRRPEQDDRRPAQDDRRAEQDGRRPEQDGRDQPPAAARGWGQPTEIPAASA
jgi:cytochrome P450